MSLKAVICPRCGASLDIEEGTSTFFCQHCGTHIVSEGDHFTYTEHIHHTDDARIKEAEFQRDIRFKELEHSEKIEKRSFKKWLILLTIAVIFFSVSAAFISFARPKKLETDYKEALAAANAQEQHIEVNPEITVDRHIIQEIFKESGELTAYKYFYTDIGAYEKDKKLLNKWSIPFTTDKSIYSYSGVISLGVEVDDIGAEVSEKEITLTIPEVRVLWEFPKVCVNLHTDVR